MFITPLLRKLAATTFKEVIDFWFAPELIAKAGWYKKDPEFDGIIREKFGKMYEEANSQKLDHWLNEPESALALIIVLDQFPRNMFRDSPKAFASDELALKYARVAREKGHDKVLPANQVNFIYLPYMHSEDKAVHEEAVQIYQNQPDPGPALHYELQHKAIIDRFGRYPHRNAVLGRPCTEEEVEFLKEHSGF